MSAEPHFEGTDPARDQALEEQVQVPGEIKLEKVRIVEIEKKETGEVLRRDCYDPDGGPAEIGDVMRLKDGELCLRVIDWAKSRSLREEPELRWKRTGLSRGEVGRIGIFTWPAREPVRVFEEKIRK